MASIALPVLFVLGEKLVEVSRAAISWTIATTKGITRTVPSDDQDVEMPEEMSLNSYALLQAYVLMGVTGLGYLALTWSTVVLLGGFVTSLGKKDFWCITAISMVQAARIFHDSGDNLFPIFLNLTEKLAHKVCANPAEDFIQNVHRRRTCHGFMTVVWLQFAHIIIQIVSMPVLVAVVIAGILCMFGPVTCIILSAWRIWQRDYGNTGTVNSTANLVPALDIFYCLVICQGTLFLLWWLIDYAAIWIVVSLREQCKLPKKWGNTLLVDYLFDIRLKCWRDPASIDGVNLINYAVEMLDSGLQKDYLSGARMIDNFIKLEADVRSLLLPSRPKIQKLIDTLGWRSSDEEIRELAARIVAYLADDIHLTQFPGALQCISSLLDATLPYWKDKQVHPRSQQGSHDLSPHSSTSEKGPRIRKLGSLRFIIHQSAFEMELRRMFLKRDQPHVYNSRKEELVYLIKEEEECNEERTKKQGDVQNKEADMELRRGDCSNELILQGLTILERLASNQHNCRDICSSNNGLLPKIMAPLYSNTLIQDINVTAWAEVVNASLRVVHRLIRAHGRTGKRLRREISSRKQAVDNLKGILGQCYKTSQELQMHAIEILTELASDLSTQLSKETTESLIHKQMQIFLTVDKGEENTASNPIELKVTAGKTLALLSKTKTNSVFIMDQNYKIVDCLSEMLDSKNKLIYRAIAAEILENLCTHCTLDKERLKESLLPKVCAEVLTYKREAPVESSQRKTNAQTSSCFHLLKVLCCKTEPRREPSRSKSGAVDDEEKQLSKHVEQIKSPDQANEEKTSVVEWQEALLSLTLVICNNLTNWGDSDDVCPIIAPGDGEFVAILKTIVEENCQATANCLRIVKLCGQIALLMMPGSQYGVLSQYEKFVESFSMAAEIMSNLESCMLFAGTDCGVKKIVRPLLFDLEKELREALKSLD